MKKISFDAPKSFSHDIHDFQHLRNITFDVSVQVMFPKFFLAVSDLQKRTGEGWKPQLAEQLNINLIDDSFKQQILDFMKVIELNLDGFNCVNTTNLLALKQFLMNFPGISEAAKAITIFNWNQVKRYEKGPSDYIIRNYSYLINDKVAKKISEIHPAVHDEFCFVAMKKGVKQVCRAVDSLFLHHNTPTFDDKYCYLENIEDEVIKQLNASSVFFAKYGITKDQFNDNDIFDLVALNVYSKEIDIWTEFNRCLDEVGIDKEKTAFSSFYSWYITGSTEDIIHRWTFKTFGKSESCKLSADKLFQIAKKMNMGNFKKLLLVSCGRFSEDFDKAIIPYKNSEIGIFAEKFKKTN